MKILAIDTSYHGCSLAVQGESQDSPSFKHLDLQASHLTTTLSTQFIPSVQELCQAQNIPLQDITHIATTTGPASFTGLRITLAALQGIAFANNTKILAVTRLKLLAQHYFQSNHDENITIHLDNQRGHYFSQAFQKNGDNLPLETSDVTLIEEHKAEKSYDAVSPQDLVALLLKNVHILNRHEKQEGIAVFQGSEGLSPFYGHTPEFKKIFPQA